MKDIFERIAELRRGGKPFALATVIGSEDSTPRGPGARMIVHPGGPVEGTVGGGALEKRVIEDSLACLREGAEGPASRRFVYDLGKGGEGVPLGMVCGGKAEVFVEVFGTGMKLFIFGAGHVGRALSRMCGVIGIAHWVIDDREAFARGELLPDAAGVVRAEFAESFAGLPIDGNSYVVIVTYGHRHDGVCLEGALKTKAAYIGMIGSRHKVRALLEGLSKKGAAVSDPRVYAPVGLHLGDGSPEQIGVSILAEILKLRSGGSGMHMREPG
jgi:xanthine dehydrogenase accessory factor